MACKKSELVAAINTMLNAVKSNDPNLVNFGAKLLETYIETLDYAPEEEDEEVETSETEVVE
mgnify:CR=1 FL=1|jgi:hypothetical protein